MKLFIKLITILGILVIFYFLVASLIRNWRNIPFDQLHFNTINLSISFFLLFVYFIIYVAAWRFIILKLGSNVTFKRAFWIIATSQIAKYIPGGAWLVLGRVYIGKSKELRAETITLSVIIETGLTILVSILLFLLSVILAKQRIFNSYLFITPIVLLMLVILYPPILRELINLPLKMVRRPPISFTISRMALLQLVAYFIGLWFAQLIGFYFLINSIYPIGIPKILNLTTAYTLSWITGFVAPFAPGGLGVREGMMALLLSDFIPSPLAIAISFLSRVWILVFEIVLFFIGLAVKRQAT
jgi:glycosyltransferase 2 family protein